MNIHSFNKFEVNVHSLKKLEENVHNLKKLYNNLFEHYIIIYRAQLNVEVELLK